MEEWGEVDYRGTTWRVTRYGEVYCLKNEKAHVVIIDKKEFERFYGMSYQEHLLKKKNSENSDYASFVKKLDSMKGNDRHLPPYMEKVICGNSKAYDKACRAADAILSTGLRGEELRVAVEKFSNGDRMVFFDNVKHHAEEMASFVRDYIRVKNTTSTHKVDLS